MGNEENNLTPIQSFEEKMKERLRKDFSELMPDEALASIVEKATEELFIKPKRVSVGSAAYPRYEDTNNFFMDCIEKHVKDRAQEALEKWLEDNEELVAKAIADFIQSSAENIVIRAISRQFEAPLANFRYEIESKIQSNNQGY